VAGPLWQLREGDAVHAVHVARSGRTCWVHAGGRTHAIEIAERGEAARRGGGGGGAGTVVSPMTGKVVEVLAAEGDRVRAGQPLLVLSAMKMQVEVKSAVEGVVRKLSCRAGEQVEGGAVLAIVEPGPTP
jgi:biotin carboxyl carrier protein